MKTDRSETPYGGNGPFGGEDEEVEDDRLTASLAGLALALSLTVISLFLTEKLASASRVGECLLQGRTNCDIIDAARSR